MSSFFQDLVARGLVHSFSEGLEAHFAAGPVTAYIGFDPTADSLHVGSLYPAIMLARLQRAGHRPIALMGGGTGMIGDPSGKSVERQLLTPEQVAENVAGIRAQVESFLDFSGSNPALIIDNSEWLGSVRLLDFLRDVGKHFTVNYMLAKESVSRRIQQEEGISVTEFSYMLLQAYDYQVLSDRENCTLQLGGSDQWGNITAGMDLIRKTRSRPAHALVFPLLTTTSGAKFGKTEAGTVWLDPRRTSPFRFYQFWINTEDADVGARLMGFTFLPVEEIDAIVAEHESNPGARAAQRRLASEVTRLVHGEDALRRAERATDVLFGRIPPQELPAEDLLDVFADVPSTELSRGRFTDGGLPVVDLLVEGGVAASKGEARRLISGGGVYINGERVESVERSVTAEDAIEGEVLLLRKGKRANYLVRLTV